MSDQAADERVDPYYLGLHDSVLSGWYNDDTSELVEGFGVTDADVIVDVGCGDGGPVAFCARRGAHIILADIDGERLARTAETIRALPARQVDTHVTDAAPLPLADGSVSRVICMEVLEHVDDPGVVVAELARVGRPGALYLISVPGTLSEKLQKELAAPSYFEHPNHVRIFEEGELAAVVAGAGLEVVRTDGYGFFWSLLMTFFWQADTPFGQQHPSFDAWALTWSRVLAGKDGRKIKRVLDAALPRVQLVVARKPG